MLSSIRLAAANICGYFSGLSSPSVTDSTATLWRSPRSKLAGQTKVADVFDKQNAAVSQRQARGGVGDHLGVEMAAFPGIDLNRRGAGGANAGGVIDRC